MFPLFKVKGQNFGQSVENTSIWSIFVYVMEIAYLKLRSLDLS